MGISWGQGRDGRKPRSCVDPRAQRGAGDHGEGGLPRAVHLCFAYLRRISPFDAALHLPPLGRHAERQASRRAEMGPPARHERLSHARGRLAAYSHAARSLVKEMAANQLGATSIEYALIASLISVMIITGTTAVGSKLSTFFTLMPANLK